MTDVRGSGAAKKKAPSSYELSGRESVLVPGYRDGRYVGHMQIPTDVYFHSLHMGTKKQKRLTWLP